MDLKWRRLKVSSSFPASAWATMKSPEAINNAVTGTSSKCQSIKLMGESRWCDRYSLFYMCVRVQTCICINETRICKYTLQLWTSRSSCDKSENNFSHNIGRLITTLHMFYSRTTSLNSFVIGLWDFIWLKFHFLLNDHLKKLSVLRLWFNHTKKKWNLWHLLEVC